VSSVFLDYIRLDITLKQLSYDAHEKADFRHPTRGWGIGMDETTKGGGKENREERVTHLCPFQVSEKVCRR